MNKSMSDNSSFFHSNIFLFSTLKDNRFSRQFYIFSDYSTMDDKYEECVKTIKEPPSPATCPVSGKPARLVFACLLISTLM